MIESLQCTRFHIQGFAIDADWDDLARSLRRRTQVIESHSAVDVTYQLEFHQEGITPFQLDLTYLVTFADLESISLEGARQSTWPYFRMAVLRHLSANEKDFLDVLPVIDPLTVEDHPEAMEDDASPSYLPPALPTKFKTDFQMMTALGRIERREYPWLRSATHLYLALSVLTDRKRDQKVLGSRLESIVKQEVGCTIEDLLALPRSTLYRYRDQSKLLFVVAIHAVTRLGVNRFYGIAEDTYEKSLKELFHSLNDPDYINNENRKAADKNKIGLEKYNSAFLSPLHLEMDIFDDDDQQCIFIDDDLGLTVIAFARESINTDENLCMVAIYLIDLTKTKLGLRKAITRFIRDISHEYENWLGEHELMTSSEDELERRRYVKNLDTQPFPIPETSIAALRKWAGEQAEGDIVALDVSGMTLTPSQFYEAARFPYTFVFSILDHPDCPEDVIRLLAYHPISLTRAEVAGNPATPEDVLWEQFKDNDEVRQSLATNRRLPSDLQAKLAHVSNERIRANLARNISLHHDLAEYLAGDPSMVTRINVAANPATPTSVLTTLCDDRDQNVSTRARIALQERLDGDGAD